MASTSLLVPLPFLPPSNRRTAVAQTDVGQRRVQGRGRRGSDSDHPHSTCSRSRSIYRHRREGVCGVADPARSLSRPRAVPLRLGAFSILESPSSLSSSPSSSPIPKETIRIPPWLSTALSSPPSIALASAGATLLSIALYWRYFRRVRNAAYLTPAILRRKMLVGKVTSVGDADGFRMYHTPGPPLLRSLLFRPPKPSSKLRDQTLSIRLAGADAPESAHFGNPAQPFAKEAKEELSRLVLGRTVWVEVSHVDQYKRLVGMPYVLLPPYILGRTNVSLSLIRAGLATVYRSSETSGSSASRASYGTPTWFAKVWRKVKTGQARLEREEKKARDARRGMWSLGDKLENPQDYKRRTRSQSPS